MAAPATALERLDQNSGSGAKPALSFDLRFKLTESEWKEASNLVHPILGGAHTKPWARLLCGFCALINLIAPTLNGTSWSELVRCAPGRAVFAGTAMLLCAAAAIWMKPLERRRNWLDVERHVMLSDQTVIVTLNDRTWSNLWTDFMHFRQGPNVVVLRHSVLTFWTIPIRAVPVEKQSEFREFLNRKLARRQPYSWSPDSSGTAH
jgi:hypothetical protein